MNRGAVLLTVLLRLTSSTLSPSAGLIEANGRAFSLDPAQISSSKFTVCATCSLLGFLMHDIKLNSTASFVPVVFDWLVPSFTVPPSQGKYSSTFNAAKRSRNMRL